MNLNLESGPNTTRKGRLLKAFYRRASELPEYTEPLPSAGFRLPKIELPSVFLPPTFTRPFKITLAVLASLAVGNLPEFQVWSQARLGIYCNDQNGEKMLNIDTSKLAPQITMGAISFVYRENPAHKDALAKAFPDDNRNWRGTSYPLPYRQAESTKHSLAIDDELALISGFIRSEDVRSISSDDSRVLDKVTITAECFARP